jgi:hypothetical protein
MAMAPTGHNGNNETNIGLSQTVEIIMSDGHGNVIPIKDSNQLFDIWIPRDLQAPKPKPYLVNSAKQEGEFFPLAFNITTLNGSLHAEIAPLNLSVGYVVLVKFNQTPTIQDYNSWKLFCPSGNSNLTFKLFGIYTLIKSFRFIFK